MYRFVADHIYTTKCCISEVVGPCLWRYFPAVVKGLFIFINHRGSVCITIYSD